MPDVSILLPDANAPTGYTVPSTSEIIPKSVSAIIDGTSATSEFYPVLEIVSDGGHVVAQSRGSSVAAGGSVEQSWFPGALTETPSALVWAFYQYTLGAYSITSDTSYHSFPLLLEGEDGSGSLGQGTGPDGVTGPKFNAPGIYVASGYVHLQVGSIALPSASASARWVNSAFYHLEGSTYPFTQYLTSSDYFAEPALSALFNVGPLGDYPTGTTLNVELQQLSGVTITAVTSNLVIQRINPTESSNF